MTKEERSDDGVIGRKKEAYPSSRSLPDDDLPTLPAAKREETHSDSVSKRKLRSGAGFEGFGDT